MYSQIALSSSTTSTRTGASGLDIGEDLPVIPSCPLARARRVSSGSGREDLNLRLHGPEPCALPGCATPRDAVLLDVSRGKRGGAAWSPAAPKSRSHGLDASYLGNQRGNGLKKVLHEPVVGHLEDRSLGVLVDGHDDLRPLHSGQVLDRARDSDGNVELGRHHLARLPDLQ